MIYNSTSSCYEIKQLAAVGCIGFVTGYIINEINFNYTRSNGKPKRLLNAVSPIVLTGCTVILMKICCDTAIDSFYLLSKTFKK